MNQSGFVIEDQLLLASFRQPESRELAFTQLIRKYQERLYWHIRRLVIVHEDADDVLQNVFIKVWKGLESFREEANLYTWLYKIATHEALSWLEKQKRRQTISIENDESPMVAALEAQKGFDGNKIEWKLQRAIQALPEKQRLVFTLRYYDEMPYEKMSEVLGTSTGALKASYHHAVKKVEDFILRD